MDSIALNTTDLDAESYRLRDPAAEIAYNFTLSGSLLKAKTMKTEEKGIFSGKKFRISITSCPKLLIKLILECKGAVEENKLKAVDFTITSSSSTHQDKDGEIRNSDWLLQSVLHQELISFK